MIDSLLQVFAQVIFVLFFTALIIITADGIVSYFTDKK